MSNVNAEANRGDFDDLGGHQQAGYQPPHQLNSAGSSKACLYGCLFLVLGVFTVLVCGVFGVYYLTRTQVQKYTSTEPKEIPTVELPEEEIAALESRIETFSETLDQGKIPEDDLVLTAKEINSLIANNDKLRGKVFVTIDDGLVSGDVSVPTDSLRFIGGKDRYFNGSATFSVSMKNDVLIVVPTAMSVNEEPLPEEFVQAMAQQNWAQDLYKDPEAAETLGKFDDIEVRDDKIILKLKREPAEEETDSQPEATDATTERATGSSATNGSEPGASEAIGSSESAASRDQTASHGQAGSDRESGAKGQLGDEAAEATEATAQEREQAANHEPDENNKPDKNNEPEKNNEPDETRSAETSG